MATKPISDDSEAASAALALDERPLADAIVLGPTFGLFAKKLSSGIHRTWTEREELALSRMLNPDWEGLSSGDGRRLFARLLLSAAPALLGATHHDIDSQRYVEMAAALRRLGQPGRRERLSDPALSTLMRSSATTFRFTWCAALGFWGGVDAKERAGAAAGLVRAVVEALGPEQRRGFARRIMSQKLQRAGDHEYADVGPALAAFGALFERGVELSDAFGIEGAKPGKSVADQVQERISRMAASSLKSLFQAEFDRKSILAHGAGALGPQGAWEAKGLASADHERLLALARALDEELPGRGAAEALAWLERHPALAARAEREARERERDAERAASSPAPRPANRL